MQSREMRGEKREEARRSEEKRVVVKLGSESVGRWRSGLGVGGGRELVEKKCLAARKSGAWSLQPVESPGIAKETRAGGAAKPVVPRGAARSCAGRGEGAGEIAEQRRAACRTVPNRGSLERGRRGSHHKSPRR